MMIRLNRIKQEIDFRHTPAFIICILCFYFTYHLLQGERSVWSYVSKQTLIEEKEEAIKQRYTEKVRLEERVVKLRLSSLDQDFLEERARYLLGYISEDEMILVHK